MLIFSDKTEKHLKKKPKSHFSEPLKIHPDNKVAED